MAPVVPFGEPSQLRAGDTWTWDIAPSEYPSDEGWTISYAIAGREVLTWSGSWVAANGSGYRITIPAASTAAVDAGVYSWSAFATLSSARYTIAQGTFEVLRDLATATTNQAQSHVEKMVELIRTALELRVTPGSSGGEGLIEKYGVAAREVERMSTTELTALLGKYEARLAQMRNGSGLGTRIEVAFVQP